MSLPKRNGPRGASLIQSLQARWGDQFDRLFEILGDIAEGKLEHAQPTGLDGTLDRVSTPSIKERSEAIKLILSYGLGSPVNRSMVMDVTQAAPKVDLDKLTFAEIQEWDRIARKAEGVEPRALSSGYVPQTVDAEFTQAPAPESDEDEEDE